MVLSPRPGSVTASGPQRAKPKELILGQTARRIDQAAVDIGAVASSASRAAAKETTMRKLSLVGKVSSQEGEASGMAVQWLGTRA